MVFFCKYKHFTKCSWFIVIAKVKGTLDFLKNLKQNYQQYYFNFTLINISNMSLFKIYIQKTHTYRINCKRSTQVIRQSNIRSKAR